MFRALGTPGKRHVKVSDDAGQPVTTATARFTSSQAGAVIDAEGEGAGAFVAKLPPGEYSVEIALSSNEIKLKKPSTCS